MWVDLLVGKHRQLTQLKEQNDNDAPDGTQVVSSSAGNINR